MKEYHAEILPSFDAAVAQFQNFLSEHGITGAIIWVFREDFVCRVMTLSWGSRIRDRRIWVKVPIPAENERIARQHYTVAAERGYGASFEVLCLLENRPCCYLWSPHDKSEAEYAMLRGLKFTIPEHLDYGRPVRNTIWWQILAAFDRKTEDCWTYQVPARLSDSGP